MTEAILNCFQGKKYLLSAQDICLRLPNHPEAIIDMTLEELCKNGFLHRWWLVGLDYPKYQLSEFWREGAGE